jgi:lipid-A-disaccharide synthase
LRKKKIYVIIGEASGDMHAANLIYELNKKGDFEIVGMGGEKMKAEGVNILHDYREVNYMGFVDVFKHLRTILKKINTLKKEIEIQKPDAVLLVDFPAFNLRIAKHCKKIGIKVIYYISPQIWAWKQSRVKHIQSDVDQMITILPFEKDFYKKFDVDVAYVGHPLLDALRKYNYNQSFISQLQEKAGDKKIIALLPGSRKQEISSKLPVMARLAKKYNDKYYFVIAGAPGASKNLYEGYDFDIYFGETYNILKASFAALVTSGTATLETALHLVPQVVCYKTSEFNYQVGKRLAKVNYISLVNLILDKPAVTELIQRDLNDERLEKEFELILQPKRDQILKDYHQLIHLLADSGASERAAEIVKKSIL